MADNVQSAWINNLGKAIKDCPKATRESPEWKAVSSSVPSVLMWLAQCADYETGENAHPSVEWLADRSRCSQDTVSRVLRMGVAMGLLELTKKARGGEHPGPAVYTLLVNPWPDWETGLAVLRTDRRLTPAARAARTAADHAVKRAAAQAHTPSRDSASHTPSRDSPCETPPQSHTPSRDTTTPRHVTAHTPSRDAPTSFTSHYQPMADVVETGTGPRATPYEDVVLGVRVLPGGIPAGAPSHPYLPELASVPMETRAPKPEVAIRGAARVREAMKERTA